MTSHDDRPARLLAWHAASLPPGLLAALLPRIGVGADKELSVAVIRRPDVPAALLAPRCTPTERLEPMVAAAWLARPEHDLAAVQDALDADPRPEVLEELLLWTRTPLQLALAVLPRAGWPTLQAVVGRPAAPVELRAAALVRFADLVAADGFRDFTGFTTAAGQAYADLVGRRLRADLANAAAPLTRDRRLLERCSGWVTDPVAADHLAEHWLTPALSGTCDIGAERAAQLLNTCYDMARLCSPAARAALATAVSGARLDPAHLLDGASVADLLVLLRGGPLTDRPWVAALTDGPLPSIPEHGPTTAERLSGLLVAELGDDPEAWAAYLALGVAFPGTVGELLDTVRAVADAAG